MPTPRKSTTTSSSFRLTRRFFQERWRVGWEGRKFSVFSLWMRANGKRDSTFCLLGLPSPAPPLVVVAGMYSVQPRNKHLNAGCELEGCKCHGHIGQKQPTPVSEKITNWKYHQSDVRKLQIPVREKITNWKYHQLSNRKQPTPEASNSS